jgi:type VI protein secretion system component Hcp
MLQMQVEGKICQRAEFHFFEELEGTEDATGGLFKLTITLTHVRISSCKMKGSSDDKAVTLTEEWEFDYGKIDFNHRNAGANVAIEKPDEPEEEKTRKDAAAGAASTEKAAGESLVGHRDYLAPLGSL